MARFRRKMSARSARHIVAQASQKTKVRAIISLLSFAGSTTQSSAFAVSTDSARVNYFDTSVKPFSHIDVLHLDLAIYQSGSSVAADGFVDWEVWKDPATSVNTPDPAGTGLTGVPYIFKTGRAAIPMLSPTGLPSMYHLSGDIKIPPRFRVMNPGDQLLLTVRATPAAAGVSYSVNGVITYMFKV